MAFSKSLDRIKVPNKPYVLATWDNSVVTAPDPTRGGAKTIGLTGRVYVFDGKNPAPVLADGMLCMSLWDHSRPEPKHVDSWIFDSTTLQKLAKPDTFGDGYTLFLPWLANYSPDVQKAYIVLRFIPASGEAFDTQSTFTLDHGGLQEK